MAGDCGVPEARQLRRAWTRGRQKTSRVKNPSWTVQNELRGDLDWMTMGAAWRILDSAKTRKIKSLAEGCVCCSENEKWHNERDEGARVSQWKRRGHVCRRIYIRQFASRLRKNKRGCESLANTSAASFTGRNEYLRTHCSLIVQNEKAKSFSQRVWVKKKQRWRQSD